MTVFMLPLSISLRSIFLSLAAVTLLFHPDLFPHLRSCCKEHWFKALIALFFLIIALSFTGAAPWQSKLAFINKYSKLLYIPLFALAFRNKKLVQTSIDAFLVAMLLTVLCSLLVLGGAHLPRVEFADSIFHNHIATGFFMAIAAFVSANYAFKINGLRRIYYGFCTFVFSADTLFINTGRTGYVIFFILLGFFFLQFLTLKRVFFYLLCVLPLFGIAAYMSPALHTSVQNALHEVHEYQLGSKVSSIGFRMQFHQYAAALFHKNPIFGVGTAGFSESFSKDNPIPSWGPNLLDPHNQYWLIAAEQGIVGILFLLLFFLALFQAQKHIKEGRLLYLGILSAFMVANLFDSFLLLSSTGYFFVLFMSLFLSQTIEAKQPVQASIIPLKGVAEC